MIEFKSWRLHGMPFFKDQTFDLSRKGISLILGKNLDSSNDNPNGAGKSLFFSELAELVMNEPLIGVRSDTVRRGTRELVFEKNGHAYKVVRSFSPKESIEIWRDGKNLDYRELTAAKEELKRLIPYTAPEVLSLFFIDSRVPHPLIRGSASARREFFLRFFHLSAVPYMRKLVKSELDKLKLDAGALKEIVSSIRDLRKEVDGKDPDAIRRRIEVKELRVKDLENEVKRFSSVSECLKSYESFKDEIAQLDAYGVSSKKEAEMLREEVEEKLSAISDGLQAWKVYNSWLETKSENEKAKSVLEAKLGADKLSNLDEYISSVEGRKEKVKERIKTLRPRIQMLEGKLEEASESEIDRLVSKLVKLDESIKKSKSAVDTCPTCGAAWDNKHSRIELSRLRAEKESVNRQIEELKEQKGQAEYALKKEKPELKEAVQKAERLEELLSDLLEYKSLKKGKVPPKPERDEETLKSRKASLQKKQENLYGAERALRAKSAYLALSKEDRALAKNEDPTSSYLELLEKLNDFKMDLRSLEDRLKDLSKLRERRTAIKQALTDLAPLELLYEAFSKKGVEAIQIKTITDRLSLLVNKYARLLFPEDYEFSFDLTSQFSFLVKRKYGKKSEVSDVRKLSGAESLLFNLVLYVALLSFVPKKNRPSLLMLDEPTSTMGPEMIEAFVKFLPTLNSVVDHIIVITPMPYVDYENAKVWTVVKKNGVSTFHEGNNFSTRVAYERKGSRSTTATSVRGSGNSTRTRYTNRVPASGSRATVS